MARGPDGGLCFQRPDGRPLPNVPPPSAVPTDPVGTLVAQHRAQGLSIHARTGCPTWLGERLDLDWAIGVLHPLARAGAACEGTAREGTACEGIDGYVAPGTCERPGW